MSPPRSKTTITVPTGDNEIHPTGLTKKIWIAVPVLLGLLAGHLAAASARVELADGFDFPVGKPDASGYYKARGYRPNGHQGEDWNGRGGGNTDLGDPIYAIGNGIVVFSRDHKLGWGNVVIIRHAYRGKNGRVYNVDSLYGHLHERFVKEGEKVTRGQKIGTMGSNRGMYYAHLHLEVRKNLSIGMERSKYAQDYSNYWDPSDFIREHRSLRLETRPVTVETDTFGRPSSNTTRGRRVVIPFLPFGREPAEPDVDEEVAEVLKKYDFGHTAGMEDPGGEKPVIRRAPEDGEEPSVDPETAQEERDKIRDFWSKFRDKITSGEVVPSTGGNVE